MNFNLTAISLNSCDLLRQYLAPSPAPPTTSTSITGRSISRAIAVFVGGSWMWTPGEVQVSEEMASTSWKSSVMLFRVPDDSRGQQLILGYERPRGTTRITGGLSVRTPTLEKVN